MASICPWLAEMRTDAGPPPATHWPNPEGRASSLPLLAPHPKSPPSPDSITSLRRPFQQRLEPGPSAAWCPPGKCSQVGCLCLLAHGRPRGPQPACTAPTLCFALYSSKMKGVPSVHGMSPPPPPLATLACFLLTLQDASLGSPPQDTVLTAEPRATRPPGLAVSPVPVACTCPAEGALTPG